jgi:DNA polymerase-3 subunit delta
MNVRPDQLASVIDKSVYPVYMVSGDEPLQQMEALDSIRAHLREQQYSEREVLDVDAQFDWQRLLDEAANMSLFASRRIVELRLPTAKPGRQGSQVIKEYLEHPAEDTVLIINAGKIDANSKKSAWYKSVEQNGMVVQCWPIPLEKLTGWLNQRFQSRGMQADADVLSYISQHVEGNLLAADQEIEKLFLLLGPGRITYADVAEAITSQSRYNVFELSDMMLKGDTRRVIKIVGGLKDEGVVPIVVNWALTKEIRLLSLVAEDMASVDYQLKRSGVWQSRIALFRNCLSRHPAKAFKLMLKRCAYIDAASKGMIEANVWDEILSLCVRLTGSTRIKRA